MQGLFFSILLLILVGNLAIGYVESMYNANNLKTKTDDKQ